MKLIHYALVLAFAAAASAPVFSQSTHGDKTVMAQMNAATGTFEKKRYTIHGNWSVLSKNGQTFVAFDEDFKTKGGPDLKVFLSPSPVSQVDGATALNDALYLGVLKSNKGAQTYAVPSDVDLSQYESLIIQCEAFSVLWGGFDLPDES